MQDFLDERLNRALVAWIRWVQGRPKQVVIACALLTLALGVYAATHLGINSDMVAILSPKIPERIRYMTFTESFPDRQNDLLVVVDGATPEIARDASNRLAARMQSAPERFLDVEVLGSSSFFERNGMLYLAADELDELAAQLAAVQPLVASIEQEPTLANLSQRVEEGLEHERDERESGRGSSGVDWAPLLDRFADAIDQASAEHPLAVSWEQLILEGSAVAPVTRWIISTTPVLDYENVFAALGAMEAVRGFADELALDGAHGVRVRITGNPVLNAEEMVGILWNVGVGGVFCFLIVVAVLTHALRSLRIVVAAIANLLCGLVWATAFAAWAVGDIGLASVTFAILFIGLGVDFSIHLGMALADRLRAGVDQTMAMRASIASVGTALVLCTVTTSIGFYVFTPGLNLGVAELGLIAGTGMFLNLALTFTLLPAILEIWTGGRVGGSPTGALRFELPGLRALLRRPGPILALAAVLLIAGSLLAVRGSFTANVLHLRDPSAESLRTFEDLLDGPARNTPWPINVIEPSLSAADARAGELERLEVVDSAFTLSDLVPPDQAEKLEILEDISFFIERAADRGTAIASPSHDQQVEALDALHAFLSQSWVDRDGSAMGVSMRALRQRLAAFLQPVRADRKRGEEQIAALEFVMLAGLDEQLERLRNAVRAEEITFDNLPPKLAREMTTPDGRARIRILPAHDLLDEENFRAFVGEVLTVAPEASGISVNIVAFANATRDAFFVALSAALLLITLLLIALWRSPAPIFLALAPLVLSSVLIAASMVALGIPYNFMNVLVIPLLLGIGVDSGIHLVHRAYHPGTGDEELLGTTTARAVFYSAVTTTVSFGALSFASHRGISSLGIVLSLGMLLTLFANLVVLPALLASRPWGGLARR